MRFCADEQWLLGGRLQLNLVAPSIKRGLIFTIKRGLIFTSARQSRSTRMAQSCGSAPQLPSCSQLLRAAPGCFAVPAFHRQKFPEMPIDAGSLFLHCMGTEAEIQV